MWSNGVRRGRRWGMLGLLVAVALVGACEREDDDEGLTEADRAAIATVRATAEAAANSANRDGWIAAYAEDAVLLGPNAPAVVGKTAIAEGVKAFPPLSNVKFTHVSVDGAGGWAYVQGTYEMTITPPGAAPVTDKGKYLEIWRKHADGSWKVHRDMHSSDLPLPGGTP